MRLRAAAQTFAETKRLAGELEELRELSSARERELDLLEYELAEIDSAALSQGEHDELLAARERLGRLDALCAGAGAGAEALAPEASDVPGTAQLMAGAASRLDALAGVDPRLDAAGRAPARAAHRVRRPGGGVPPLRRGCAGRPAGRRARMLQEIEERLAVIERLVRKHGGSIEAVLDHGAQRSPAPRRAGRRGGGVRADRGAT